MKKKTVLCIIAVLILFIPHFSQENEIKKPIETGKVSWQIPVLAENKTGEPVISLKRSDFKLLVDQQEISDLKLKKQLKLTPTGEENSVFLLFDTAMSAQDSTADAKEIALEIINNTPSGSLFYLLTIKSHKGLTVIGKGSNDNENAGLLMEMIRKEIKGARKRKIAAVDELGAINVPTPDTYASQKMDGIMSTASRYHQQQIMSFINAFQSLSLFLNSMPGNKTVYFFSQGNYEPIRKYLAKDTAMYHHYLSGIAKDIAHCGALLIFVNPGSGLFGESTMQMIANQCGAKYVDGESYTIIESIKKMSNGFYNISFADDQEKYSGNFNVKIEVNRPGIFCYTPQVIGNARPYIAMSENEKQRFISYLISNPQHDLVKQKISAYNINIIKAKKEKGQMVYKISIPPGYQNHPLDLYKCWVRDNDEIAHIEKQTVVPDQDKQDISFQLTGEAILHYFVLVDGPGNTARVCGKEEFDSDPEINGDNRERIMISAQMLDESELRALSARKSVTENKKRKNIKIQNDIHFTGPLEEIMNGVAGYCDNLKKASFSYQCKENIHQTRIPLTASGESQPYISQDDAKNSTYSQLDQLRTKLYTRVNTFENTIIFNKLGNKVEEKCEPSKSPQMEPGVSQESPVSAALYLAERPLFIPITLLDRSRWGMYDYRFVKYEKQKGHTIAIIEVTPKKSVEVNTAFGTLWIDMDDFSLLKMEVDSRSLRGYNEMTQLAKKLKTKLYFTLVIEYSQSQNTIRFPSKIQVLELYKGGPFVSEHRGTKGWERNRVVFSYTDYKFNE